MTLVSVFSLSFSLCVLQFSSLHILCLSIYLINLFPWKSNLYLFYKQMDNKLEEKT